MNAARSLSLRHKVTALALTASLLVLVTASLIFYSRQRASAREASLQMLKVRLAVVGETLATALEFKDNRPVKEAFGHLAQDANLRLIVAYDENRAVVEKYPPAAGEPAPARAPVESATYEDDILRLSLPVRHNGAVVGTLYVVRDMAEVRAQSESALISAGLAALIALGLGVVFSGVLNRLVSEPILRLAGTAQSVAVSHDFSLRAVRASADEPGALADRFNEMLAELQQRDTALAEARGQLEERVAERTQQLSKTLAELQAEAREREAAQQAFQRAQEKYLLHVAQTPMAVIDWNPHFAVVSWNKAAEHIFGYTAAEAIGRRGPELIIPSSAAAQVGEIWQSLLKRSGGEHSINENVTKDGRTIHCEWFNTTIVGPAGEVLGVSSFCADITNRVNLEVQLRQSQKMQAVGQLAAGVAHDFNNLLTVIRGNASLLDMNTSLPAEDRISVQEVQDACTRAASLTQQLLAFSRKQVMQPRPLDLNELVGSSARLLGRLLGEQVTLHCKFATTSVPVRADRGMLDQVVMNLAVNARDAMNAVGELAITTSLVTVTEEQREQNPEARPGQFCRLSVRDTGCGMDAATQARIFEPFFTTKEVGKGTGLGLATVYGIVKQHNGWIECLSAPGAGTTFHVLLPFQAPPKSEETPQADTEAALRGTETILLVEDESAVRDLSRRSLARLGYNVLTAENGANAERLWRAQLAPVPLLVTDLVMPGGITGVALAERLRREQPDLKVIFTSGYSPDLFGGQVELKEGTNFLPKPYAAFTLARAVRTALDS